MSNANSLRKTKTGFLHVKVTGDHEKNCFRDFLCEHESQNGVDLREKAEKTKDSNTHNPAEEFGCKVKT